MEFWSKVPVFDGAAAALKHSAQSSNIFTTFPTKDYVLRTTKGFPGIETSVIANAAS